MTANTGFAHHRKKSSSSSSLKHIWTLFRLKFLLTVDKDFELHHNFEKYAFLKNLVYPENFVEFFKLFNSKFF